MPESTALLMGYYGARNVGDDLMLEYLQSWIRRQGLRVSVLGENERGAELIQGPGSFVRNAPLSGQWSFPGVWLDGAAWKVVKAIKKTEHLVVGGGDLFRDDRGWRTFLYPFEKILLALSVGTPVHLVNVGLGVPNTAYGKRLYRLALPRCRTLLVRDERSLEVCRVAGAKQAVLVPDAVFAMEAGPEKPREVPEPYVVVALRFLFKEGKNVGIDPSQLENLAKALDRIVADTGFKVVFVPFQDAKGWQDEVLHRDVQKFMKHGDAVFHRPWSADHTRLIHLFNNAEAVLCMPLHATVLAIRAQAKLLSLPYDIKCWELAKGMIGGRVEGLEILEDSRALGDALEATVQGGRVRGMEQAPTIWSNARLNV